MTLPLEIEPDHIPQERSIRRRRRGVRWPVKLYVHNEGGTGWQEFGSTLAWGALVGLGVVTAWQIGGEHLIDFATYVSNIIHLPVI